jgi:hypothetical protein
MENNYISNQITKYQTNKKLIAFTDKLVLATVEQYATIHSAGGKSGNFPSRIGVNLLDYSKGTGDKTIQLAVNLSVQDIAWLNENIKKVVWTNGSFEWNQSKIQAVKKGSDGRAPVTSIKINRSPKDAQGNVKNLQWYVNIANGTGIPQETSTGGIMCGKGTFQKISEAFINLRDEDIYKCFYDVVAYINLWQLSYGIPNIKLANTKRNERG